MKTWMTRDQTQDDMSRDRLDEDGVMGIKNWSSVNMANHNMKWRKARRNACDECSCTCTNTRRDEITVAFCYANHAIVMQQTLANRNLYGGSSQGATGSTSKHNVQNKFQVS